jgi:chromosome segregation ATPase
MGVLNDLLDMVVEHPELNTKEELLGWPGSMSIMAEEISHRGRTTTAELRSLIAGLSQHLDDLYTELEDAKTRSRAIEEELRKAHENLRARANDGRFRRFRNWCRSRGRRILGR